MPEIVNHPAHYNAGRIEVLDFLLDQPALNSSPLLWQVVRYICRSPFKGDALTDLKKAQFYLNKQIELLEKADGNE